MNTQTLKQQSETREQRAKAILEIADPQELDENTFLVPSQFDSSKKYQVTYFDSYSCNCKDFETRCKGKGLYCKHIKAILLFKKLKNRYETEELSREIDKVIFTPTEKVCPYCSHHEIFKRGQRKNQNGVKQLYCCKKCKKRFVLEPIKKIKGNAKLVCLAMDSYYKGLSYRDISDQFKQFYGLNISHVTIRNWILKFTKLTEQYSKTLTPKTCGVWNADETMVLTKRHKDKDNRNKGYDYLWNVMDNKSKFILASLNSGRKRSSKQAEKVFREAYKNNVKMPNQIIVDGFKGYQDGCRKVFRNWGNERKVKFTSIKGKRKEVNNNAVENLHTHQKEMLKVRRGVKEVQDYADGFKVFHNFVRKGVKDKLTPAQRCGIEIVGNKWHNLLLNSIKEEKATQLTGEEKMMISH